MANRKRKITLYFTNGSRLTEDDIEAMDAIPGGALHRNAALFTPGTKLEHCDAVAGPAVPAEYAERFEVVEGSTILGENSGEESADASKMNVAELRAALDEAEVAYPAGAKKAALVKLYNEHVAAE